MELTGLTAARVLRERFQLEAELSATPSPLGAQLEMARTQNYGDGQRRDGLEEKRLRYMTRLVLTQHLNPQELLAARLYYWELTKPVFEQVARLAADLQLGDGRTVLHTRPRAPDGTPMIGWSLCSEPVQRKPSFATVAEHMARAGHKAAEGQPITAAAVRRRLSTARSKVSEQLLWRQFKQLTIEQDL